MIAGINKVYAGTDEVIKVYAGTDLVYTKESGVSVDDVIAVNPLIQAYIRTYPYLYQRCQEYPFLLFSLATDKPYMATMANDGTNYVYLPVVTSSADITITGMFEILVDPATYPVSRYRIFGGRTGGYGSTDDDSIFMGGGLLLYNRIGELTDISTNINYSQRNLFEVSHTFGTTNVAVTKINNSSQQLTGTRYTVTASREPRTIYTSDASGISVDGGNTCISKVLYNNMYELVPFSSGFLDIRNNQFYHPNTGSLTFKLYNKNTKDLISNPSISLLL